MMFVMDHLDLTLIFGHEDIYITIVRVAMVAATDYLTDTGSLATHIMKMRKIIEVAKTTYCQHRPSNFSTKSTRPR